MKVQPRKSAFATKPATQRKPRLAAARRIDPDRRLRAWSLLPPPGFSGKRSA